MRGDLYIMFRKPMPQRIGLRVFYSRTSLIFAVLRIRGRNAIRRVFI